MLEEDISAVRAFNRFYTQRIGVLAENHLGSAFSLAEVRTLYELAHADETTASQLAQTLGLDPATLSRLLARFHKRGWIRRRPAADRRAATLSLTEAGAAAFAPLAAESRQAIEDMIAPLGAARRRRLAGAMAEIESLIGGGPQLPVTLRGHRPGDMGWVVSRHGALYAREYGWDMRFEALVAEIAAKFIADFDPSRDACFIATQGETPLGSAFVVRGEGDAAKLRLVLVEPEARGLGVGRMLVEACMDFAGRAGYRRMMLWTNDILVDARRLYQKLGFTCVARERHHSFGHDLVGETWERDL